MSFFRNIRESITRGKSSSRDTTPVRATTASNSRPESLVSNSTGRSESMESRHDNIYKRSDTYVLPAEQAEKKPKKSNVLTKFSTFTKRSKTPAADSGAYAHHPSDNATNTYYKWTCSDGPTVSDYDARADPFNFLYERQSSLKNLQKGSSSAATTTPTRDFQHSSATFDSSTFRKTKLMPTQLREHLDQLKSQSSSAAVHEEDAAEPESGKYKTITLNSFRKSFRDKFLQQQKDAAHNPAWFVEVEPPPPPPNRSEDTKENTSVLVFANENYRPHSRSPVRNSTEQTPRPKTRSPVKRNETFRLVSPARPSIRIEIKNSITPHLPGRIVPVGVAKPMPATHANEYYHKRRLVTPHQTTTGQVVHTQNSSKIPAKNWSNPIGTDNEPHRNLNSTKNQHGRYQTLVQIGNDAFAKPTQTTSMLQAPGRHATRIHLSGVPPVVKTQRYLRAINAYPPVTPTTPPTSYEKLPNKSMKLNSVQSLAKPRQTYFGDAHFQPSKRPANTAFSQLQAPAAVPRTFAVAMNNQNQQPQLHQRPMHANAMSSTALSDRYLSRHVPQQQPRVLVSTQRRSRSPIKMPWR